MCTTCGCGTDEARIEGPAHAHRYEEGTVHSHAHGGAPHHHDASAGQSRTVSVEQDILAKNDALAASNREALRGKGIFAVNLVSSPGSGKTTLLEQTIGLLQGRCEVAVIEGDQQTSRDADRIRSTGARAVQVNTGRGCHLDAHMVAHAIERLSPAAGSVLMIENVGNLVCPAAFDLGEAHKVVVLSVTEGEDKPLKYPDMFRRASLMLLNKTDLLPYVDFDVGRCVEYARRVNPAIQVLRVSAKTGEGLADWIAWVESSAQAARGAALIMGVAA